MLLDKKYAQYAAEQAIALLQIDSPTGYTKNAIAWIQDAFAALGCQTSLTNRGALLVDFGGTQSDEGALLFEAHTDTLGAMVCEIKGNGRLKMTKLGGLHATNTETENVTVHTRSGKTFEGTIQVLNPSVHVNANVDDVQRSFDTVEVVLDERVSSAKDVKALGIDVGDFVCPFPRAHITPSGYIKSRFLDDKLSVATLLGFAKFLCDNKITLPRRTYALITTYEEVGHGGSAAIPADVREAISVDMGCVGDGIQCTECQVSICAKDSGGPYDFDVTNKLIAAAKAEGADYAIDVYPHYGSDVEATLRAGYDVRHGLIGPGVFASHGYERSHVDGVYATLLTIKGYLHV